MKKNNNSLQGKIVVESTWMLITPEMAESMLKKNTGNRRNRGHVGALSLGMSSGKWREDLAPPIILGFDGVVLDGQHRLWAVIDSGVAIWTEVRRVADKDTFGLPIDSGKNRDNRDLLRESKFVAEIINAAASLFERPSNRDMLVRLHPVLAPTAEELRTEHGGIVKLLTTSGIRAGFCIVKLCTDNELIRDNLFNDYDALKSHRPQNAKIPSSQALYSRIMTLGGVSTSSSNRLTRDMYCVLKAYKRVDAQLVRLVSPAEMAREVRETVTSLLNKAEQK